MTKISDIAQIISVSIKNPSECGFDRYVGLEHYDSGEPMITRYGSTELLTTSVKHFKAGDVLLARRNVNLRRAGLVDFEGITSGDSIVLRPNNAEEGAFLPFILNTTTFWDWAEANSDGTMSKRLSPKVLVNYEFDLPPLSEQKVLAEKLWAAYRLKESYKRMIEATDEMVKSQFIEMFGELSSNTMRWPISKLGKVAEIKIGPFGSLLHQNDYVDDGHYLINPSQILDNIIKPDAKVAISDAKFQELSSYTLEINDIVLGRRGEMGRAGIVKQVNMLCGTGSIRIRPKDSRDSLFIHQLITSPAYKKILENNAVGTTMQNLNVQIVSNLDIPILPTSRKDTYIGICKQADKSKFELREAIKRVESIMKSLMNS